MSSIWTTIVDAAKGLLASKGTQLLIRVITAIAAATGTASFMKDETTTTIAAGGVAFLTVVLDYISDKLRKASIQESK